MNNLDSDTANSVLKYDPEAGLLFWKARPVGMFKSERHWKTFRTRFEGKEAFTSTCHYGYRQGQIFGKRYVAHRIIWLMVHGNWPKQDIDHINGNRQDNRLFNLRSVSRSDNLRNTKIRKDNLSGVPGVFWRSDTGAWSVRVNDANGGVVNLGCFKDKIEADLVRKEAEIAHGYHENHGRADNA